MSRDRKILKGLDELLDGAGNRFGPMLLNELQKRLSKTVKLFDLELKEMLESSFKNYHDQINGLKMILDYNFKPAKKPQEKNESLVESDIPEFIKKFDKK